MQKLWMPGPASQTQHRLPYLWDCCKLVMYVLLNLTDSLLKIAEASLRVREAILEEEVGKVHHMGKR